MLTVTIGLALALMRPYQSGDALDSSLRVTSELIGKVFDLGYEDAKHAKSIDGWMNQYRRGIGGIQLNKLGTKQTVSFVWVLPYQAIAYAHGFEARKKYLPAEEVEAIKRRDEDRTATEGNFLTVFGRIHLSPSFGGFYGRISNRPDPEELKDVRVVLEINGDILQPERQPGDILTHSGTGTNEVSTPASTTTYGSATATGPNGTATVSGEATSYYTVTHAQNYEWFEGSFRTRVNLFDADGKARIPAGTKKLTCVVVYGRNERRAEYYIDKFAPPEGATH